jgi:polyhydroxyalkanoate synthesis regulator protein
MSEQRLIKKYANRRLYDASQSRHITLDKGVATFAHQQEGLQPQRNEADSR